jgi:hypothetical protein
MRQNETELDDEVIVEASIVKRRRLLEESSTMMYRYIGITGEEHGPFSMDQMQQWMSARMLPYDLRVRYGDSFHYKDLGAVFPAMFPSRIAAPAHHGSLSHAHLGHLPSSSFHRSSAAVLNPRPSKVKPRVMRLVDVMTNVNDFTPDAYRVRPLGVALLLIYALTTQAAFSFGQWGWLSSPPTYQKKIRVLLIL